MGRATSGFATLPAADPSLGFGKERVQIKDGDPLLSALRLLAHCADPNWWTQTIAFTAIHARAPGG